MYRTVKTLLPNLDPIYELQYKNGDWHQMFSTMDKDFYSRYVRKMHVKIAETVVIE